MKRFSGHYFTLVLALFLTASTWAAKKENQTKRGRLLQGVIYKEIQPYFASNSDFKNIDSLQIDINNFRSLCNFLHDPGITKTGEYSLPKKKTALKRHVKKLCESIEMTHANKNTLSEKQVESVLELALMSASFKQKAQANAEGVDFFDKINIGRNTYSSDARLVSNGSLNDESAQVEESPFWHPLEKEQLPQSRFDDLAKEKNIDFQAKMVVVFKEVSVGGSSPKINATDIRDPENAWSIKWGDEIHTDVVGSRIFAALGFDVDHPYYSGQDDALLVFPKENENPVHNSSQLIEQVYYNFKINISPWISHSGIIDDTMIQRRPELAPYKTQAYVTFIESMIEARPDKVKRLGSIMPNQFGNSNRSELRGSLLAHLWIGNWDTREENTLLSIINMGKQKYRISGAFSDLGSSFGVSTTLLGDFRTGRPNQFPWQLIEKKKDRRVYFNGCINHFMKPFKKANFSDLKWMAEQIAKIDGAALKMILAESGWPAPIQEIYYNKLASRRDQILEAFDVSDPSPIAFTENLEVFYKGTQVVSGGQLLTEIDLANHPVGFLKSAGRNRNFGNTKIRHAKNYIDNEPDQANSEEQRKYILKKDLSKELKEKFMSLATKGGLLGDFKIEQHSTYTYSDIYLDTDNLDLFKENLSLRLRKRDYENGEIEYIMQLKNEMLSLGDIRMEVDEPDLEMYKIQSTNEDPLTQYLEVIFKQSATPNPELDQAKNIVAEWINNKIGLGLTQPGTVAPLQELRRHFKGALAGIKPILVGTSERVRAHVYNKDSWVLETSFDQADFLVLPHSSNLKSQTVRVEEFEVENKFIPKEQGQKFIKEFEQELLNTKAVDFSLDSKYKQVIKKAKP